MTRFAAKLNRREAPYVISDEVLEMTDGKCERYLDHDNINDKTLEIYTKPGRQGDLVLNYTLEIRDGAEWKRYLRVFGNAERLYANYESYGDTVEADDVNELQQAAVNLDADLQAEKRISQEHRSSRENPHDVTKRQIGLGRVEDVRQASKADFDAHKDDTICHLTELERLSWNDKYTKNQVDNKFSALETAIDWKESVASYEEIAGAYPEPEDGWTVNVKDTGYTYRYSGSQWVVISANAIPKATQSVDGLLSKEDKEILDGAAVKLAGMEAGANKYVHPESHPVSMIRGLAEVAVSGRYSDLLDQPDLSVMVDMESSNFSGIPTAPTAEKGTDTTQIATTAFVQSATAGFTWDRLKGV